MSVGTGLCEASESFVDVIVSGTGKPKACYNIPNTDDRTFQLFLTTNEVGVHLGNQQSIATLDIGLYHAVCTYYYYCSMLLCVLQDNMPGMVTS